MNETARAARKEREERHKRQLQEMEDSYKRRLRRRDNTSALMFILLFASNIFHYINTQSIKSQQEWRTDQAPVGHPYYVVTRGYVGHDNRWRSFDTGQPIEVTHWTTNTVGK